MKEFNGRVAVVTGAASGIGLALARKFGSLGMKVVLADVEAEALDAATAGLIADGVEALGVRTDVMEDASVRALANRTLEAFGGVHVLCNNAGVFCGHNAWTATDDDWNWVLGVNLWGVIHGVRAFLPIMLAQETEGHVVNTASMAATVTSPFNAAYTVSKHAVLSYSEVVHHELAMAQAKIRISALCPELIATNIDHAERNRPDALADHETSPARELTHKSIEESLASGTPPEVIADRVLDAIREERFYVFSDDGWRRAMESRLEDMRLGRNPTFVLPFDE